MIVTSLHQGCTMSCQTICRVTNRLSFCSGPTPLHSKPLSWSPRSRRIWCSVNRTGPLQPGGISSRVFSGGHSASHRQNICSRYKEVHSFLFTLRHPRPITRHTHYYVAHLANTFSSIKTYSCAIRYFTCVSRHYNQVADGSVRCSASFVKGKGDSAPAPNYASNSSSIAVSLVKGGTQL